ncbi:Hpt domain-containing protein [Rhodocaloribacter litoris]|uniref:Hpt domain-containing protein n=1 Tax=Rhodocaloribacter litoris TaxID=2558931 RepID=UPI00142090CA|nr:Hpt domain-containing protein [Rhodocaloribacter litoris]QXD14748.1 Hpt domain-containing protein [Rhodocaloribacter litoris]GIV59166.1 MAG: hypothetical protein KatS3mg043_0255 [Rhodothermaceae bacterium]
MSRSNEHPADARASFPIDETLRQAVLQHLLDLEAADPAFLADLIESYLTTTPELIAALEQALARQDTEALHAGAHSLKSSTQLIGLSRMSRLCLTLEQDARKGFYTPDLDHYVSMIAREYARAAATLTALMHTLRHGGIAST